MDAWIHKGGCCPDLPRDLVRTTADHHDTRDDRQFREMNSKRAMIGDALMALAGAGLNTLFVALADRNVGALHVAMNVAAVLLVAGLVSTALAWAVRTVPLAIVASIVVTELLFLLYFVCRVACSSQPHPHAFEELYLLPQVFAVYTAPTVVLGCIGFVRLASRLFRRTAPPA